MAIKASQSLLDKRAAAAARQAGIEKSAGIPATVSSSLTTKAPSSSLTSTVSTDPNKQAKVAASTGIPSDASTAATGNTKTTSLNTPAPSTNTIGGSGPITESAPKPATASTGIPPAATASLTAATVPKTTAPTTSKFDYTGYLSGIKNDRASLEEAANFMLSENSPFKYGNATMTNIAKAVLSNLQAEDTNKANREEMLKKMNTQGWTDENFAAFRENDASDLQTAIDRAYNLITKGSDTHSIKKYLSAVQDSQRDIQQQIGETSEWLANRLDFSGWDLNDPAQKAKADSIRNSDVVKKYQAELENLVGIGNTIGVNTDRAQQVLSNGNYLVSGVTSPEGSNLAMRQRTMGAGEPTTISGTDGNYSVVGTETGKTIATGIPTLETALATQTQQQSGGTPSLGGRPDLYALEPTAEEKAAPGADKAFTPYVDLASGKTITPTVATPEQLAQHKAGTLESFNNAQGIPNAPTSTGGAGTAPGSSTGPTDGSTTAPGGTTAGGDTTPTTDSSNASDSTRAALADLEAKYEALLNQPQSTQVNALLQKLQDDYVALLQQSDEEKQLKRNLTDFYGNARLGISNLEGQGRGIPLELIRGQQSKLETQANIKAQTLEQQLATLMAERESKASVLGTQLGYATDAQSREDKIKEQNRQDQLAALKSGIDFQGSELTRRDEETRYQQERSDKLTAPTSVGNSIIKYNPETGKYETLYTAPETAEDQPSSVQEYEYAKDNGYTGSYTDFLQSGKSTDSNPYVSVSPGSTLYDPSTNTPVYTAPANETKDSAEMLKLQANVQSGLDSLSTLKGLLEENKGLFGRPLVASGSYKAAENNLIDIIGRLRSGGAITADEEARFKDLLPAKFETQKTVEYKLGQIESLLNNTLSTSNGGDSGQNDPLQLDFNNVLSTTQNGSGMRTDRHNNPTAFTTDVARVAGLKEGVDYVKGDPFSNGQYYTAKLLGDPIATTIKVIDNIGFQTQSGQPRWTYINMPKAQWDGLDYNQKKQVIASMYKNEGGTALSQFFG